MGIRALGRFRPRTTLDVVLAGIVLATLAALAIAVPNALAASSPSIDLSAAQVKQMEFVAGAAPRLATPEGAEDLVSIRVLQQMYRDNHFLDPGAAASAISAMKAAYPPPPAAIQATIAPNERILSILSAMQSSKPTGVAAEALSEVSKQALTGSVDSGLPIGRYLGSTDLLGTLTQPGGEFDPVQAVSDTVAMARTTPQFATARNDVEAAPSGEQVLLQGQVLVFNLPPQFTLPPNVDQLINDAGSIQTEEDYLNSITQDDVLPALQNVTADAENTAVDVQNGTETQSDAKTQSTQRAATIKDYAGGLVFVEQVLKLVDPALAKTVTALGNAVVKVATAVNKFASALTALGKAFSTVTALGAAAATGN
ncbi:MAG: hypothetical protein ACRDL8_06780, partial [Solirubrobacteraceae bacterium]